MHKNFHKNPRTHFLTFSFEKWYLGSKIKDPKLQMDKNACKIVFFAINVPKKLWVTL